MLRFRIKVWVWGLREKNIVTIWQHSYMALTGHIRLHLPGLDVPFQTLATWHMCYWVWGFYTLSSIRNAIPFLVCVSCQKKKEM